MNNNIEETYVSFEVAKLLKEKGFDVHCDSYYEEDRSLHQFVGNYNSEDQKKEMSHYSRPTQSICIKWIRENFGIYIYSSRHDNKYHWQGNDGNELELFSDEYYNTPEEATEAALKYCLKNLM